MTPGTGTTLSYGFDASGNLTTLPTGATGTYDNAGELTSAALSGTTTSYTYNADGERLTAHPGRDHTGSGTWNGAGQLTSYSDRRREHDRGHLRRQRPARHPTTTGRRHPGLHLGPVPPDPAAAHGLRQRLHLRRRRHARPSRSACPPARSPTWSPTLSARSAAPSAPAGTLTARPATTPGATRRPAGGLTASTPFGYAGGYTDPTGLIYLINRYYDPATGQFLSVDPEIDQTRSPTPTPPATRSP